MVGPRTPEERIADLESENARLRLELADVRATQDLMVGAAARLEADHDDVAGALRRGRLPARGPGGREIEIEPRRSQAERDANQWLTRERARVRAARGQ